MALNLPEHLANTSYKEPEDSGHTAYIDTPLNPEKLSFFARCRWQPEHQESFAGCMSNITNHKQNWTDYFDTRAILRDEQVSALIKTATPIFVDVGGSTGLDVTRFLEKHPDVPEGSIVLQDVPDVVAMAKVDSKINKMPHDFFKAQPILGRPLLICYIQL